MGQDASTDADIDDLFTGIVCRVRTAVAVAKLPNWKFLINSRGVATLVSEKGGAAYGVVWAISRDNEKSLDFYEGVREKIYSFLI